MNMAPANEHTEMGFDEKGAARNRSSLFAAAGIEWPIDAPMEFDFARDGDYPFSVDVSNNRVLTSLDRSGSLRRIVTAFGYHVSHDDKVPGVYVEKDQAFCEGEIALDTYVDGRFQNAPALSFIRGILPVFRNTVDGLTVAKTVFAPRGAEGAPQRIVSLVEVTNDGEHDHDISFTVRCDLRADERWNSPLLNVDTALVDAGGRIDADHASLQVSPGESAVIALVVDVTADQDSSSPLPSLETLQGSLSETLKRGTETLGRLEIPEDPWAGELVTRAAELARQTILLLPNGNAAGSFWGSNATPTPGVWQRDLGYTLLGVLECDPALAAATITFMGDITIPDSSWGFAVKSPSDVTPLQHSLGNACLPAILAAMLITRHGAGAFGTHKQRLDDYLIRLSTDLVAERPESGSLYQSVYISDGPSRGVFHTGSNVLAWRAAVALSTTFAELIGAEKADALASIAKDLRAAIDATCIRRVNGVQMYVPGIYADGEIAAAQDGEESDLTLASVYGFVPRDDYAVRENARWAHSPGNPYFAHTSGGVDFWNWDTSNGIAYPGHIHALVAASSREEFTEALEAIRRTTDLDGSFWWWPFPHAEPNPDRVTRSLSKCGWAAGSFVAKMVHDVLGVQYSHDDATLTFAPYTPWNSFTWHDVAVGEGTVTLGAEPNTVWVENRTGKDLHLTVQVPLQAGVMLENVKLNGEDYRVDCETVQLFDSVAVRARVLLPAGEKTVLEAVTVQD